jgi:hypothetical protein
VLEISPLLSSLLTQRLPLSTNTSQSQSRVGFRATVLDLDLCSSSLFPPENHPKKFENHP